MKIILLKLVSILYVLYNKNKNIILERNHLFLKANIKIDKKNHLKLTECHVNNFRLNISGNFNEILANNSTILNTNITIDGNNNSIILKNNSRFIGNIIVRGQGCKIEIGNNTTFGGVRIVNVGVNNDIIIGNDCMFSDMIEIWASDTHTIFDKNNDQINPEKPIIIGNHVWVGSKTNILKGVTIGSNSIIGMGSLVTKSVSNNTLSAGVPNKTLKNDVNWSINYKIKK
ncbi:DapH/DapD/GlmU-related protein [Flammeovirga sp. OC4]|uniref:acyltransferase n=1 Tax=Flammeovirga sp. OC4 TaxID=1382345 RepID=UPI0005C6E3E9|nr:acyltransferase [Flammeovirga sp. OC4]